MGMPNGEMDPWADAIVATRFRYVQVSAFYDQLADLPTSILGMLPANDFGARASKPPVQNSPRYVVTRFGISTNAEFQSLPAAVERVRVSRSLAEVVSPLAADISFILRVVTHCPATYLESCSRRSGR